MNRNSNILMALLVMATVVASCGGTKGDSKQPLPRFTGAAGEVKLITLDPGHFHAALIQKNMYSEVSPEVYVYAPEGSDLDQHLARIDGYNKRADSPTAWNEVVYKGSGYLEKMLDERHGNVVVLAGNNRIKTDYIQKSIEAGFNVLSDKPMVISADQFPKLEESFKRAAEKGVLLYDIMTERYEITTLLQKEFSQNSALFGNLLPGTAELPAVEKISVHHFYKNVSGNPLVRPAWFFDVNQQGEGIVDVTTHLVDLVQWGCFPGQVLEKSDISMLSAKRWPTVFTPEEFRSVTLQEYYPGYLQHDVKDGNLNVFANGEMIYKIKGHVAKVVVEWRYKAPDGTGDTHYSIMRGTNCSLEIRQGEAEKYSPTLYLTAAQGADITLIESELDKAVKNSPNSGLGFEKSGEGCWKIIVPDSYKVGHEAHFAQVTARYLEYLRAGKLPEWEVPNMIVKYYTTTEALKLAKAAQ